MSTVLLRQASLGLRGLIVDVEFSGGMITRIGPEIEPGGVDDIIDLDRRVVVPGLWDHHVHLDQWALTQHSLDLSRARGPAEVVAAAAERLRTHPVEPMIPLVGYGFRDALWDSNPHRRLLDAVSVTVPLVMVSADLHQAWVNRAALRRFGLPDDHDGLLREDAWFPYVDGINEVPVQIMDRWVAESASRAAARGVVGVIDYEFADNLASWPRRHARTPLNLRVRASVWPEHLEAMIDAGLRTGDPVAGSNGLVTAGHLKVITDGSLNTRTAYCYDAYPGQPENYGLLTVPPEQLVPLMQRAADRGIGCSIHAIGDHANGLALDAFARTGARGSIEHAQLLTDADVHRFAEVGVVASIQPEHAHDDRDVADHHWAGRCERAFAYGALHRAGVQLLLGSDAPVAPLDPLLTIAAAISRSRDGREAWHSEHELPLSVALAASTGTGRTEPRVGDVADLTVIDLPDLNAVSADGLRTATVAGTLLAGRWTHRDGM